MQLLFLFLYGTANVVYNTKKYSLPKLPILETEN